MSLKVRIKKKASCKDCAFKSTGSCKKNGKCDDYLPITPTCKNCGKESCSKKGSVKKCKKWEPDTGSPFVSLIKELSAIRSGKTSRALSLIDDSDFKQAPNFITFCLDYLKIHPFPKQIEEGSFFFADICFHCSNPEYQNLYDESLGNILDNMVFLEFGKCPKCKKNRFELMEEFPDKMHWYQELVGVAGQRSGKCVTPDTLIPTEKGFVRMDSFSPEDHNLGEWADINETILSHDGPRKAVRCYKEKAHPIKIKTRHGFELKGRKEHPIRILQPDLKIVWKTLSEVKKGDIACIERKQNLWTTEVPRFNFRNKPHPHTKNVKTPKFMTKALASVLGYLVSGGWEAGFINKDREVTRDYEKAFKECFDWKLRFGKYGHSQARAISAPLHESISLNCGSIIVKEFLYYIGYRDGSFKKEVPWSILQSPKEIVAEFIRAYFERDGHASEKGVSASSVSKKLIKQLQVLLLNFGIVSFTGKCKYHKNIRPKNGNKYYWSLSIRREYRNKFMEEIGFVSDRKNNRPISGETKLYDHKRRKRVVQGLKNLRLFDKKFYNRTKILKHYYFFSEIEEVKRLPYKTTVYDIEVEKSHSFIGNGFVNHNSELCAQISAYVWHWYTKLAENPAKFFGLLNTRLHMTFTALTYGQAKKNLWNPFYDYLKDSPWFIDYHKAINSQCSKLGIDEAIKFPDSFILYKHRNLECAPVGPDKRVLRGPTRILEAIDELGWFTGAKSAIKINPDEVYNALSNSLATIRGQAAQLRQLRGLFHVPTAYAINISSPSSARDKIMRLLYQSRKIKTIHAFHLPTWEMNPNLPKDNELFETEFQKNPADARRDFGAFPPLGERPFIVEITPLWETANPKKRNMFDYSLVIVQTKSGKQYASVRINKIRPCGKPILVGVDAGRSGNAFAITATSYNNLGQVVLEGAIEVKPLPNLPVNFNDVYKKGLRPILKTQSVIALLVDQWQSIDLIDKVDEEFGDNTEAIRYSLRYGDFEEARQHLLGERVVLPLPEVKEWKNILKGVEEYEEYFLGKPISHLYLQLATVQDSGRRIEKSDDLDDDLFRALILCVRFTFDEKEGFKYELMSLASDSSYGTGSLGIVRGISLGDRIQRSRTGSNRLSKTSLGQVVGLSGRILPSGFTMRRPPKKKIMQ